MKKYFLLGIVTILGFIMVGCNKEKDILKDLSKTIEKTNTYYLDGELEIVSNEDSYKYDVTVAYEKENHFKVSLKNKINNHEQIILKNDEGVYVLTPSLNKSFKFDSVWPYNNSQIYILQTIMNDLNNDKELLIDKTENGYLFTAKANYTNNKNLIRQKVNVDKDMNIKDVSIYNDQDVMQMKMTFNNIDYKATFDENYFNLNSNTAKSTLETSKTIDSIVYPMYMPVNTNLVGQEKVYTDTGERIILTFNGDSPFMIVQENSYVPEKLLTIPMYGEPYIVTGTVGALSDSSISWSNNGVDYYVVSEVLKTEELIDIANSISVKTVSK